MVQNVFNKRGIKLAAAVILAVTCIIYLRSQDDTTELNEPFINMEKVRLLVYGQHVVEFLDGN